MKFQIKAYDVIILDYDVKNKVLALDSNHIVNVAMWPKLDNSSISVREINFFQNRYTRSIIILPVRINSKKYLAQTKKKTVLQ